MSMTKGLHYSCVDAKYTDRLDELLAVISGSSV